MVDCSQKLRMLRETRHLTQLQVANLIGVSKAMISAYETAIKTPSIDVLIRLSGLFGVTIDYLVCVDSSEGLNVTGLDDDSVALVAALIEKLKQQDGDSYEDNSANFCMIGIQNI